MYAEYRVSQKAPHIKLSTRVLPKVKIIIHQTSTVARPESRVVDAVDDESYPRRSCCSRKGNPNSVGFALRGFTTTITAITISHPHLALSVSFLSLTHTLSLSLSLPPPTSDSTRALSLPLRDIPNHRILRTSMFDPVPPSAKPFNLCLGPPSRAKAFDCGGAACAASDWLRPAAAPPATLKRRELQHYYRSSPGSLLSPARLRSSLFPPSSLRHGRGQTFQSSPHQETPCR